MDQAIVETSLRAAIARRHIGPEVSLRSLSERYGLAADGGLRRLLGKLSNFRMIVLGDSVIWGQGLREEDKTFALVAAHLRRAGDGLAVLVANHAHSGATIGTESERSRVDGKSGEVPWSYPTLFGQLDQSGPSDDRVDLVLVNGGLNDFGFTAIIDPVSDLGEEDLRAGTRRFCRDRMAELLIDCHRRYPNAQLIVQGYYPILSGHSSILYFMALLSLFGLAAVPILASVAALMLPVSALRCGVFHELSNECLGQAVARANAVIGSRAKFAAGNWSSEHALFTPESRLLGFALDLDRFDPGEASLLNTIVEGDAAVGTARWHACMAESTDFKCPIASIGHPNAEGARANATAITALLAPL